MNGLVGIWFNPTGSLYILSFVWLQYQRAFYLIWSSKLSFETSHCNTVTHITCPRTSVGSFTVFPQPGHIQCRLWSQQNVCIQWEILHFNLSASNNIIKHETCATGTSSENWRPECQNANSMMGTAADTSYIADIGQDDTLTSQQTHDVFIASKRRHT